MRDLKVREFCESGYATNIVITVVIVIASKTRCTEIKNARQKSLFATTIRYASNVKSFGIKPTIPLAAAALPLKETASRFITGRIHVKDIKLSINALIIENKSNFFAALLIFFIPHVLYLFAEDTDRSANKYKYSKSKVLLLKYAIICEFIRQVIRAADKRTRYDRFHKTYGGTKAVTAILQAYTVNQCIEDITGTVYLHAV